MDRCLSPGLAWASGCAFIGPAVHVCVGLCDRPGLACVGGSSFGRKCAYVYLGLGVSVHTE